MRIVIDLQACQNGSRQRGIGRYAMAITRALIAMQRGHDFRIVLSDGFPDTIAPIRDALADILPQDHIRVCAMPGGASSANPANAWRTRAAELVRAQFIAALAPDLVFVPSLFEGYYDATVTSVERHAGYRTAVTLFDFIPIEYPDEYLPNAAIRAAYHRKLAHAAAADLLLPISHYVASQAAGRLDGGTARLVTISQGVDPMFRPPAPGTVNRAALMARHGIARPFVLNTSPLEFRKNIAGLIVGFAAMPRRLRDAYQLVIVGRMDDRERRTIDGLAQQAGLSGDAVVLPGYVPDDDLIALYGECAVFAFPSISEGFGLPVLEAMACGAPAIGSATTSIPEVIGRADLLFDPAAPQAIGAAMARVLDDPALRATLCRFGPERAAGFTWEAVAATMLDAFEALEPAAPASSGSVAAWPDARVIVVPTMAAESGFAGLVAKLLPDLGPPGAVTIVCADGSVAEEPIAAVAEVRDMAWFERHFPLFGPPVYVADGTTLTGLAEWMAMAPGILLLRHGDAAPASTGTLEIVQFGKDDATLSTRLALAYDRCTMQPPRDPARTLAAHLPRMVRDVRPSGEDLARVARALARNEAQ